MISQTILLKKNKRKLWELKTSQKQLEEKWRNEDIKRNSVAKQYNKHKLYEKIELTKMKLNYLAQLIESNKLYKKRVRKCQSKIQA